MHELPQNLTNSLRSYRGSIYSSKAQQGHADGADVEKGPEDYGDKDLGRETESSLILVGLLHSIRNSVAVTADFAFRLASNEIDRRTGAIESREEQNGGSD